MRTEADYRIRIALVVLLGLVAACAAPSSRGAPSGAAPGAAGAGEEPAVSGAEVPPGPPATVRAAFVVMGSPVLPSWIAVDRGINKRYNLDVELIYIPGQAKVSESLLAREID